MLSIWYTIKFILLDFTFFTYYMSPRVNYIKRYTQKSLPPT